MKKSLYLCFVAILSLAACNNTPAPDASGMKEMSKDTAFQNDHQEPLPADTSGRAGKMIQFDVPGGGPKANAYLVQAPEDANSKQYLLVFQEWWGLNDHIKNEADRYAKDLGKVNVLALDLYDGKVADKREDAAKLVQSTDDERLRNIIRGAVQYIGDGSQFASLGWCFGGGWSLQSGILVPEKNIGVVMYYGMPEENMSQLKKLNAPVLGIFGTKDENITPEVVAKFQQNMKKAGKPLEVKNYNATHAFANPSNPTYDKAATDDARKLTLDFLRKQFKL